MSQPLPGPQHALLFPTSLNTADNISRYLLADGHRTWGFVIYRCTYESESEWAEFLSRLRFRMQETLKYYNGLHLLESLDLTIIEDRDNLDDVEASVVRENFKTWVQTAPQREQNQAGPRIQSDGVWEWESQRYMFCIQVDAEVLNSVVHWAEAPPAIDAMSEGFVKIIARYWEPYGVRDRDPPQEAIEGCTEDDVGWMMVDYKHVVDFYDHLRTRNDWSIWYSRPPKVACA